MLSRTLAVLCVTFCFNAAFAKLQYGVYHYSVPLEDILDSDQCLTNFIQINGDEPLALCDHSVGVNGVPRVKAIHPSGLSGEFDFSLDDQVLCSGGLRADAHIKGAIQVYANLSPWRSTYTDEQFERCFEKIIQQLSNRGRLVLFEVTHVKR